ncbi:transposase family protein [Sinorhizobium sp. BJ1]|uniref:transposase family protein n=1 Tax=Sinorhizobium sp. BJ1 TaxID=2035455 RepID=UPI0015CF0335|nr:transposase family protein [Sinorhizobium sp. BJ1]
MLVARPTAKEACCPCCGSRTARVHSHYQRRLADLPWHGCVVRFNCRLAVRDAPIQVVRAKSSRRDLPRPCLQKHVARPGYMSTILRLALPRAENPARAC